MAKPATTTPRRGRLGALLRHHRAAILAELLLLLLLFLLPAQSRTILLLLIGWFSLWLRGRRWGNIGLRRPANWPRTVLAGVGIGVLYQGFSIAILVPVLHRLTGTAPDLSQLASLRGNLPALALWLLVGQTAPQNHA